LHPQFFPILRIASYAPFPSELLLRVGVVIWPDIQWRGPWMKLYLLSTPVWRWKSYQLLEQGREFEKELLHQISLGGHEGGGCSWWRGGGPEDVVAILDECQHVLAKVPQYWPERLKPLDA
jgi:hypothetical protein